uniref:CWH43-like N-terminal domain-containing protein n=1 Tax=Ditylenchus dipsaci TaxID=166011 RepID=A0A915E3A6_9BILA
MFFTNLLASSPDIEVIAEEFVEKDSKSKIWVYQPILSFDFNAIYVCIVGLPVIAIVSVFCIGIAVNRKELFNYDWNGCGTTFLPSVSRIINLPAERIVWNFLILLHASFWPLSLVQIYLKHRSKKQTGFNSSDLALN